MESIFAVCPSLFNTNIPRALPPSRAKRCRKNKKGKKSLWCDRKQSRSPRSFSGLITATDQGWRRIYGRLGSKKWRFPMLDQYTLGVHCMKKKEVQAATVERESRAKGKIKLSESILKVLEVSELSVVPSCACKLLAIHVHTLTINNREWNSHCPRT